MDSKFNLLVNVSTIPLDGATHHKLKPVLSQVVKKMTNFCEQTETIKTDKKEKPSFKMGSDQSLLPAGAQGSTLKSQRDEEIPYTQYSLSKPIGSDSARLSPRSSNKLRSSPKLDRESGGTPKHDIVVVADGTTTKIIDPEIEKLNSIPVFFPIIKGTLNLPTNSRETDLLDRLDYRQLLLLCVRYQEHLKQLSEAVAFDQNALCIRIKEVDHTVNILLNTLSERQKKYMKYAEQTKRINETLTTLQKVHRAMDDIIPKMDNLNKLLPVEEQLEPFTMRPRP